MKHSKQLTTEPSLLPPDWREQLDDTLTIKEALQNIVDSAIALPTSNGVKNGYRIYQIDFDNAVEALKRGI